MQKITSTLLIVWHSRTSASQQCAISAQQSAISILQELQASEQVQVRCLHANHTHAADLLAADAYLFFAPENLGSLSGEMKAFFDRNYYEVIEKINGRPYSALICAGSAGQGAVKQLKQITKGWRLELVQPISIIHTQAQSKEEILANKVLSPAQLHQAAELGGLLAAQLALSY